MARRVRIGVSVFFAVLTVLFCGLWVRSYWRYDRGLIPMPGGRPLLVYSVRGELSLERYSRPELRNKFFWKIDVIDEDFRAGEPMETPRLRWYSIEDLTLTGVAVPYRFQVAVCGILALVAAYSFPAGYNRRERTISRLVVAAILVFIVWLAS